MPLELFDVRTEMLNPALGLAQDYDALPWGDEETRDQALVRAVRRLWPRMARLVQEEPEIVEGIDEYTLSGIWDLETLHVLDSDGRVYKEIRNFRNWVDMTADPPTLRLLLPIHWSAGTTDTLQAIGFQPYDVWYVEEGST